MVAGTGPSERIPKKAVLSWSISFPHQSGPCLGPQSVVIYMKLYPANQTASEHINFLGWILLDTNPGFNFRNTGSSKPPKMPTVPVFNPKYQVNPESTGWSSSFPSFFHFGWPQFSAQIQTAKDADSGQHSPRKAKRWSPRSLGWGQIHQPKRRTCHPRLWTSCLDKRNLLINHGGPKFWICFLCQSGELYGVHILSSPLGERDFCCKSGHNA